MTGVEGLAQTEHGVALSGQVVVVAGGAGEVGEGVVRCLLEAGATVIAPSRSRAKLDQLQAATHDAGAGRLIAPKLDVGSSLGADVLCGIIDSEGRLDAVVSSIGGFWHGPSLLDVEPELIRDKIEERVFPHLRLIQTLGPRLAPGGGAFIHLSGLVALFGMAGLSALGVSTAAQLAVTRAYLAEASGGLRVYGLVIEQFVRTRSRQDLPADALAADEVGAVVRQLIGGSDPGALLALRKVDNALEVEPLPAPISPASIGRLARALGQ